MHKTCLAGIGIFALGCQLVVPPEKAPLEDAQVTVVDVGARDASVSACMTDPTYTGGGEHRYKFYPSPSVDYDTAIDRCAADGAHLVVVDSIDENLHVQSLINGDTWIGLDDLTVEADFRWTTGATGDFRLFNTGEPDNRVDEDCVFSKDDGKWEEIRCGTLKRVLCECDPAYLPPPTPLCRQMPGATTREGRWYFSRTTPRTWQDAENDCKSIGAHLLVIGDLHENALLDAAFNGIEHWIGYTDAVTDGVFQWVNGSPSPFHRFTAGVPTNVAEDCSVLLEGGAWDDQTCSKTFPYACECDPSPP